MVAGNGTGRPADSGDVDPHPDARPPANPRRCRPRERWVDVTDHDLERFEGQADRLSNALRTRYGWSEEEIDGEMEVWEGGPEAT